MARTFASGEFVNHGSDASLDTIPNTVGELTVWAWVRRQANGINQHVITKESGAGSLREWRLVVDDGTNLRLAITRDTTNTDCFSVSGVVPLNRWTFVAGVFDEAAAQRIRLYTAPLNALPVETSYASTENGSGAISGTTGPSNVYVGNIQRGTTSPFLGRAARGGVIARALTLGEIEALFLASLSQDIAECNVADTRLLFDYDGSDLTDHSGNGNTGTATGTTLSDHVLALGTPDTFFETQTGLFDSSQDGAYGAMAWQASTGRLHAFGVTGTVAQSRYSDDEGATWSTPVNHGGSGFRKIPLYRSAFADAGYVYFLRQSGDNIQFIRSTDDGATWETPVTLGGFSSGDQARASICSDGTDVHILMGRAGQMTAPPKDASFALYYWRSLDRGATWENSGNAVLLVEWDSATDVIPAAGAVAAEGGVVHVAYARNGTHNGEGSSAQRARYIRSADRGATWSSPLDISGDALDHPQIRPRPLVRNGRVIVFWEEALNHNQAAANPNATRSEIRGIRSDDAGLTWGATFDLTNVGQGYLNHPEGDIGPGNSVHVGWMFAASQATETDPSGLTAYRLLSAYGDVGGVHEVIDDRPTVYGIQNLWRSANWAHVLGNGIYSRRALAPLTLWFFTNSAAGDGWPILQMGGVDPTEATTSTGWDVTGLASGQFSRMEYGVVRAASTFSSTPQPSGPPDVTLKDGWRSATALSGTIAAGDWLPSLPLIAGSGNGANVRLRFRVWRSANADMSSATEVTSGAIVGSTITNLTGTQQVSAGTVNLPEVTLSNEYLCVQVALETV